MTFVRKIHRGDRVYYAEVESVRVGSAVRQRLIRYLGTFPDALPTTFPLKPHNLSFLALKLADGSLTPNEVFEILQDQGARFSREELDRVGLLFSFKEKKSTLSLSYARTSPRHRRGARRAVAGSRRTRRGAGRSSPSKATRS